MELFPGTIKENVCRMRIDLPDEKIYAAAMLTDVHEMISSLPAAMRLSWSAVAHPCREARSSVLL